jgi:hypothetical protein
MFALAALAVALITSAQPATRRPTNIAALKQYPGFYHNRPILIVGTVSTTDKGIRVSDDDGSFSVLFKGSAPDGLDETRGDIGRMPDEPQLASYDLQRTFGRSERRRPAAAAADAIGQKHRATIRWRRRRFERSCCIRRATSTRR